MSKQGMTIQEWAAEIDRQSKSKRDLIVSTASMRMNADTFEVFRKDADQSESFGMTDHFQRQLGSTLGILPNITTGWAKLTHLSAPTMSISGSSEWSPAT